MTTFISYTPSFEDQWRAIVLFGRNVASYKFALSRALLSLGQPQSDLVRLDELAEPFMLGVARHLQLEDKQGTSRSSRFLDACRAYNAGDLSKGDLLLETQRGGERHRRLPCGQQAGHTRALLSG